MQIPIINGIYADTSSDFRTSYPRNLIPVPKQTGISAGYLRPAPGIVLHGTLPGIGRGGINWGGKCYRVAGTRLLMVGADGVSIDYGEVAGDGYARMDFGFDYLAIAADKKLYLFDGSVLQQVADTDLGQVIDVVWVDGYYMATDGVYIVVTELNDPFSVNPLKYGSSEVSPDNIVALRKVRNEVHALNRYTIEVFQNVGGDYFPFQRVNGGQITKGCVGTNACCVFNDMLAFLGSGAGESIAVYLGINGSVSKISTREIDQILDEYQESVLSTALMECRIVDGHSLLYLHLSNQTLVYDAAGSQATGEPVWFVLTSSVDSTGVYLARHHVYCNNQWTATDPVTARVGKLSDDVSTHYGMPIAWEFATPVLYAEGRGIIMHAELVGITGNEAFGDDARIWMDYSNDGLSWSQKRYIKLRQGMRMAWLNSGMMKNWQIRRFGGDSTSRATFSRLEMQMEPMNA